MGRSVPEVRLFLVLRRIVQLDCLAELLADSNTHIGAVVEVSQVTQSVVELRYRIQNQSGAVGSNRVGRDVDFVEDFVVL